MSLDPHKIDRLWTAVDGRTAVCGLVHGVLPNKSNARQLVKFGDRPALIKSPAARAYEEQFRVVVLSSEIDVTLLHEADKLFLRATVYQENMRRDLDCELLPDLLQKFGVIKNDRAVWEKHYYRKLDKENPRVEFEVGVLTENGDGREALDESPR